MNVLQNLIELYNHLPLDSTYREVAKGILMHLEQVADATIYDVAELTNSSRTTIWRMVQKMGYHSYSDFRHALKQSVGHYSYYNRIIPMNLVQENVEEVFSSQLKMAVKDMKTDLSVGELKQMAELIFQKERISFYLPFRSSAVSAFQQNLAMAGKETGAFCLLPDMLADAKEAGKESLVFFTAIEHAEAQDMTDILTALKEREARIAMFSSGESRYERFVDVLLCSENSSSAILSNIVRYEMYLFALSEVFRKHYIDK